ncbi:A/G-specific adenine glycosylase [Bacteroidia bacterium]|nr:A/G-specific adenine glycosylase [Bacteroidia bacterium]
MFAKKLFEWHAQHGRNLPWRAANNPYSIWVSEIILQQTRVAQGMAYYHQFLQTFPTVQSLASAPLDNVLKVWQGLGYYTRARNMHLAAQQIVQQYKGVFPSTYNDLRTLRGVGHYTACAIASFAFGLPLPAIDGNAYRIFTRIFGIATPIDTPDGQKEIRALAQKLMDAQQPARFNQAVMDFGATHCTPQNPQCQQCPFARECYAWGHQNVAQFPVKSKQIKIRNRYFSYLIIRHKRTSFVQQRTQHDIWHSLYEFPLIETPRACSLKKLQQTNEWLQLVDNQQVAITPLPPIKHILTHQVLWIKFYIIDIPRVGEYLKNNTLPVSISKIVQYPMPQPLCKLLNDNKL